MCVCLCMGCGKLSGGAGPWLIMSDLVTWGGYMCVCLHGVWDAMCVRMCVRMDS